jgi:hypothetical protein
MSEFLQAIYKAGFCSGDIWFEYCARYRLSTPKFFILSTRKPKRHALLISADDLPLKKKQPGVP